jgi:hypothetical protein
VDNIKMDRGEMRGGVDWIGLAQDKDQWRAFANAAVNLHIQLISSLAAAPLVAFRIVLSSIRFVSVTLLTLEN